ncbi:MAG: class I adenylate-forming enzyme family protein [Acidimicrobiales bacterium]
MRTALECRTAVELFELGVAEFPESPAIFYFESEISQRELLRDVTALAWALQAKCGVNPGDRVAIMMQNIPPMVITYWAAWLIGAIVTPVNVMSRPRELLHQLNDSGSVVLVCQEAFFETVAGIRAGAPLVHIVTVSELDYLDDVPPSLRHVERITCPDAFDFTTLMRDYEGEAVNRAAPSATSPALIMYTSGTTGLPKGAVVTHGGFVYNAVVWKEWYHLDASDVVVAAAPLFHITGLMGSLAASRAAKAPLILAYRFDAGELLRLIERWRGTWIVASLTAFIAMLEHPDLPVRDLTSLGKAASGGAPVSSAVVDRFEAATGIYVHNAYGLTETASAILLVPLGTRSPASEEDGSLAVGVPVFGAAARIVPLEDGDEVSDDGVGELWLRGPTVTPGYWENPSATSDAMRDGWFRTGDVAKRDIEGWIWIVDRVKDMIISSGYKVWPREVEDVLYAHPAVLEAGVVGVADAYRGERVEAFVVLRRGFEALDIDDLEAHCRENLAAYKIPREFHLMEELPKTASGKTLRRELRGRVSE